jgi:hypothetical protein
MPAGAVGTVWDAEAWDDTAWEAGAWAEAETGDVASPGIIELSASYVPTVTLTGSVE